MVEQTGEIFNNAMQVRRKAAEVAAQKAEAEASPQYIEAVRRAEERRQQEIADLQKRQQLSANRIGEFVSLMEQYRHSVPLVEFHLYRGSQGDLHIGEGWVVKKERPSSGWPSEPGYRSKEDGLIILTDAKVYAVGTSNSTSASAAHGAMSSKDGHPLDTLLFATDQGLSILGEFVANSKIPLK